MIDIGSTKQLFVDDALIDSMVNVFAVLHPGRKHPANPLLAPDRPWEGQAITCDNTALYDPDAPDDRRFRLWYHTLQVGEWEDRDYPGCLYAHSPDGIHWQKPDLGTTPLNGDTKNNALWANNSRGWRGTCGLSCNPDDPDADRRYKMLSFMGTDKPEVTRPGYGAFFSPDGIRWHPYEGNPVLPDYDHVTLCEVLAATYNEQSRSPRPDHPLDHYRYYGSAKYSSWSCPPVPNASYGHMRRAAGLMTSQDFIHWSPNHLVLQPDELDDSLARRRIMQAAPSLRYSQPEGHRAEFYGMGLLPYGDVLLGFLWVFDPTGQSPAGDVQDGPVHLQLTGTRNLRQWNRLGERMPILAPGEPGQWDCGVIYSCNRPMVVGDEIRLYYGGCNQGHGTDPDLAGAIGLATWRLDGFVSINANKYPGTLTTKPVTFNGRRLVINYATSDSGSIRVALQDESGLPLPPYALESCREITGDEIEYTVNWKHGDDVSSLAGREIRLQFTMTHAKLFSFRFAP